MDLKLDHSQCLERGNQELQDEMQQEDYFGRNFVGQQQMLEVDNWKNFDNNQTAD